MAATVYNVFDMPMTVTRTFTYQVDGGLRSTLDNSPHDGRPVKSVELHSHDKRYSTILSLEAFTELSEWR